MPRRSQRIKERQSQVRLQNATHQPSTSPTDQSFSSSAIDDITTTTNATYKPYSVIDWDDLEDGHQWCCSCGEGPGDGHIILCDYDGITWGHVQCYNIDTSNKYKTSKYFHTCFACKGIQCDADNPIMSKPKITKKLGLTNMGSTCYMNSIIQALLLSDDFTSNILRWDALKFNNNNSHIINQNAWLRNKQIIEELQNVLNQLQGKKEKYVSTEKFFSLLPSPYCDGRQEDAAEFVKYLLNCIWETINYSTNSNEYNVDEHEVDPFFGGVQKSNVICSKCGDISSKFDYFTEIAVSLTNKKQNDNYKHLDKLINKYLQIEILNEDDQYFCIKCNENVDAQKCIKIVKPPSHLIVDLKRFSWSERAMRRLKINDWIDCPLTVKLPTNDNNDKKYVLYASVIHSGKSAEFGHYYTIGRHAIEAIKSYAGNSEIDKDIWYKFNDLRVNNASYDDICKLQHQYRGTDVPYLLFYKIIDDAQNIGGDNFEYNASTENANIIGDDEDVKIMDDNDDIEVSMDDITDDDITDDDITDDSSGEDMDTLDFEAIARGNRISFEIAKDEDITHRLKAKEKDINQEWIKYQQNQAITWDIPQTVTTFYSTSFHMTKVPEIAETSIPISLANRFVMDKWLKHKKSKQLLMVQNKNDDEFEMLDDISMEILCKNVHLQQNNGNNSKEDNSSINVQVPDISKKVNGECPELIKFCYDTDNIKMIHLSEEKEIDVHGHVNVYKQIYIEYGKKKNFQFEIDFILLKQDIIDLERYGKENATRKEGFRPGGMRKMLEHLFDDERAPLYASFVDNNKKRFTADKCIFEWECGRKECDTFKMIDNSLTIYKNTRKSKLKIIIFNQDILDAQTKYNDDNTTDNKQIKIKCNVYVLLPHLHKGHVDKEVNQIRPDPHYYQHRINNKTAAIDQNEITANIQTKMLKKISDKMIAHGNLFNVGSYEAISKQKSIKKQQKQNRISNNMRNDIDAKKEKYYYENLEAFERALENPKQHNINRTDMRAMQTLHFRSALPFHVTINSPQVMRVQVEKKKKFKAPETIQIDWHGKQIRDFKRCEIMDVDGNDKVRKTKNLVIANEFLPTDAARNGGGNLLLLVSLAEVGVSEVVIDSINILNEKYKRLFGKPWFNWYDRAMCDCDDTIFIPLIQSIYGLSKTLKRYLCELWFLFLNNKINQKIIDIMLCMAHHNKSRPRHILYNLKGTGCTKIEITKFIINDLRIWRYLQSLPWSLECRQNAVTAVVLFKAYNFLTTIKEFDLSKDYVIYFDGKFPWDLSVGGDALIDSLDVHCDDTKESEFENDTESNQIWKFIQKLQSDDSSVLYNDDADCVSDLVYCEHCSAINIIEYDEDIEKGQHLTILCQNCDQLIPKYISTSKTLLKIPIIAGPKGSDNILTWILVKERMRQQMFEYIIFFELTRVQKSYTSSIRHTSKIKNVWQKQKELKSTIQHTMMAVMILPCAMKREYSSISFGGRRTGNTNAHIEKTIDSVKAPKKAFCVQEYIEYINQFMLNRMDRYSYSLKLPKQQRRQQLKMKAINKETSWKKDMNHDEELQIALDCFQRKFKRILKSPQDVVNRLNDMGCDVDASWLQSAINNKHLDNEKRQKIMDTLNHFISSKRVIFRSRIDGGNKN